MRKELISSSVIADSGVSFGTSGARALVSQLTPEVCMAFTHAFVAGMRRNFSFDQVAIAIDNRPSSYAMATACAYALHQLDIEVIYYGVVPTPALAYVAQEDAIPAIMITGSHIPFDRNGIKFYRPDGEISKSDEQNIINEKVGFTAVGNLEELTVNDKAVEAYISRYTSIFDKPWLTGKRIGIYEHSSAGRDIYWRIFERLGAEVISLGRSDKFVPIDTEAVSNEDKAKAIAWSKEHRLDAVFSTDGDGDRPLLADENGDWLRGDILGLLAAASLHIQALAIPVSCNTAVESSNRFRRVERTRIGSPYVISAFDTLANEYDSIAGFEANGGFLLGSDLRLNGRVLKALPTRDALLPAIMVLHAAGQGKISTLVDELPKRFTHSDRIQNFATERSRKLIRRGMDDPETLLVELGFDHVVINEIDETDGLRITFEDGRIVHLRPSGNAPELRCYAEAASQSEAEDCVVRVLGRAQKISISSVQE